MKIVKASKCKMRYVPEDLMAAVKDGGINSFKSINAVIEDLCMCMYFENVVFRFVLDQGGNRIKAEEVFEEGLIKLGELLRKGQYKGGKIEAFAIQICKNIWLNMRRKKDEQLDLTDDLSTMDRVDYQTPEYHLAEKEKSNVLQSILQSCLDESCRKMMQMKFIEGQRHEYIAQEMGLSNANSSKEKLNRCKKGALKCIQQRDDFMDLLKSVDFYFNRTKAYGK
ncbi:MAG: sigma-70 family RNA polymerase sigma factor [Bacteroidota bacterium]